jgi:hypothetical protein
MLQAARDHAPTVGLAAGEATVLPLRDHARAAISVIAARISAGSLLVNSALQVDVASRAPFAEGGQQYSALEHEAVSSLLPCR